MNQIEQTTLPAATLTCTYDTSTRSSYSMPPVYRPPRTDRRATGCAQAPGGGGHRR